MTAFSVLLSVYYKEDPDNLCQALNSIWETQRLKPTEIVLVKDGVLTPQLDRVIVDFAGKAPLKLVPLIENVGLGVALSIGIEKCSNEIIARMDTDDVAQPERFATQIPAMISNQIDLMSSNILEFPNMDDKDSCSVRALPHTHEDICKYSKWRCPFNHMAVVYRKSKVLEAGNYMHLDKYEDYYLWVRMIQKGCKTLNIEKNLVYVRGGTDMLARRKGAEIFKSELAFQQKLLSMKYINLYEYFRNINLRVLPRLLPTGLFRWAYGFMRK